MAYSETINGGPLGFTTLNINCRTHLLSISVFSVRGDLKEARLSHEEVSMGLAKIDSKKVDSLCSMGYGVQTHQQGGLDVVHVSTMKLVLLAKWVARLMS